MDHSDTLPPDGIPQDVWDTAVLALPGTAPVDLWMTRGTIARAIMAERERCANLAEDHGAARKHQYLGATTHKAHKEARDYQSMSMAAYQVAADIRGGQS